MRVKFNNLVFFFSFFCDTTIVSVITLFCNIITCKGNGGARKCTTKVVGELLCGICCMKLLTNMLNIWSNLEAKNESPSFPCLSITLSFNFNSFQICLAMLMVNSKLVVVNL